MQRTPIQGLLTGAPPPSLASRLNNLLIESGLDPLDEATAAHFAQYCALLLHWNARTNLTAIRDEDGILSRHFVESIACARALPAGIVTLLDFGSGAGFPGVPIALCRPEIAVTLAESQGKKAAFLQEAVRTLGLAVKVHAGRAELLKERFDCVTLRAVDRMASAVETSFGLLSEKGLLALMTTEPELAKIQSAMRLDVTSQRPIILPGSNSRILALGRQDAKLQ